MVERPRYEFAEPSRSLYGKYGDSGLYDSLYWADYGEGASWLPVAEPKPPALERAVLPSVNRWLRLLPAALRALTPVPAKPEPRPLRRSTA